MFFLLLCLAFAHNWIHGTSRALKASQTLPAPPRAAKNQPHRQVGAGQDFVIEWMTGHKFTWYYFVVLKSDDEDKLELHTESLLDDYINNAPSDAYLYNAEKYQRMHVSCSYNYQSNPDGRADCDEVSWNSGTHYERIVTPADSFYIDRSPWDPNPISEMVHFKYPDDELEMDKRVAYANPNYPWIEAVHKFPIIKKFTHEWDHARFSLPARQGSGEYMVHMVWQGYRDVIDIYVLPAPAVDIYGQGTNTLEWIKTDHCQFTNWNDRFPQCFYFQPGDSVQPCLDRCIQRGTRRCRAVNVVPLYTPSAVKIHGNEPADANVPWGDSSSCNINNIPASANQDTLVCYDLDPIAPNDPTFNPETEDEWYVREKDPEDPIFYSTCYRLTQARTFTGNVACPACERSGDGSGLAKWQIGDQCLDCSEFSSDERPLVEAKFWKFADVCDKCF